MSVRRITAGDVEQVLVLCHRFRREWQQLDRVLGPLDEGMVRRVVDDVVLTDRGAGWFIERESEPVGLLLMALVPNLVSGELSADELVWWVDPHYRSGSAGGRLLRVAVEWASEAGAVMVKLVTPYASQIGPSLASRGWVPVETSYVLRL